MSVDPDLMGRTLEAYLVRAGAPLVFRDRSTNETHVFPFATARDPAGVLPVFLAAGEAIWQEVGGKPFGLDIRPDCQALLGHRLVAIGGEGFQAMMLSVIEAASQATGPEALVINELRRGWADAQVRTLAQIDARAPRPAGVSAGVSAGLSAGASP